MTFKLTTNSLLGFLNKNKYLPKLQEETGQICILFKHDQNEFHTFLRPLEEGELLQILVYLPVQIKEGCEAEVARLLHKINYDVDVPGFGMYEPAKLLFYRIIMPCPQKVCNEQLLTKYISVCTTAASSLLSLIASVATGEQTYSELCQNES